MQLPGLGVMNLNALWRVQPVWPAVLALPASDASRMV